VPFFQKNCNEQTVQALDTIFSVTINKTHSLGMGLEGCPELYRRRHSQLYRLGHGLTGYGMRPPYHAHTRNRMWSTILRPSLHGERRERDSAPI